MKGAWVTLATNDSYSLGALVLAHSLKQVGTTRELAILITPGVTNSMRTRLSQVFNLVQEVNVLDSRDQANLRLLQRPELGITFTKLHCWRLTQYEKCVFLDADTLVLQNCDELFDREELSAAPDVGWPDCFNSGVFVYRPSGETYDKLIQFALDKGSFDGGDQGLLNLYFSDWAHKDISKHLPFIYNVCSTAFYSYLPAFKQFGKDVKIIHFIGSAKPWLQYFDTETQKVRPSSDVGHLAVILQRWWDIFCSLIHPNLSPDMTTSYPETASANPPPQSIPRPLTKPQSPIPHTFEQQNVWDPWEEYELKQQESFITHSSEPFESHNTNACSIDAHEPCDAYESVSSHFSPVFHVSYDEQNNQPHDENNSDRVDNFNVETYSEPPAEEQSFHDSYYEKELSHNDYYVESSYSVVDTDIPNDSSKPHSNSDQPQSIEVNSSPLISTVSVVIPSIEHCVPNDSSYFSEQVPSIQPSPPPNIPITPPIETEIEASDSNHQGEMENQKQDSGLAGAFAKLTLGQQRSPEQEALEDSLRRQNWEQGNIDYLGRDSFENIWNKICETLSKGPQGVLN